MTLPDEAHLRELAEQVGARLRVEHDHLVTAESCTGGWIAKTVTDIAGSSDWFDSGMVAYSYEAKQALLGVRPQTLEVHGAVSRETVIEMVSGALVNSGASVAVAVTGIAGPGEAATTSRWARSGLAGSGAAATPARRCSTLAGIATRCAARPWRQP